MTVRQLAFSAIVVLPIACAASPSQPVAMPTSVQTAPSPAQAVVATAEEKSQPSVSPPSTESAAPGEPKQQVSPAFPERCADDNAEGICGAPVDFTQQVCGGTAKPDVALRLFAKGSPWTRGYVQHNTEAWYTGRRSTKGMLKFQEEVIVLRHPEVKGGIVVNDGGGPFDVMRLDGTCATLAFDEVSLKRPSVPNYSSLRWRQLDPLVREALLVDPIVAKASATQQEVCRKQDDPACGVAETKLTSAVVRFLDHGGRLPTPVTRR